MQLHYLKDDQDRDTRYRIQHGRVDLICPGSTHAVVHGNLPAMDRDDLFATMNGHGPAEHAELWKQVIDHMATHHSHGVHHSSMSVGDIVVDEEGRAWLCCRMGWTDVTEHWTAEVAR